MISTREQGNEIITAIHQAREYRPDGIIAGTDLRDVITVDEAASAVTYPYSMLNEILRGIRKQEMITVLAGSGVGKSTFVRELAHHLHQRPAARSADARRERQAVDARLGRHPHRQEHHHRQVTCHG